MLAAISLSAAGCGLIPNFDWTGEREFAKYAEWRQDSLNVLSLHIGKTPEEIKSLFGEPTQVREDIQIDDAHFDLKWFYHFRQGPFYKMTGCMVDFYFNDGLVVKVDVM